VNNNVDKASNEKLKERQQTTLQSSPTGLPTPDTFPAKHTNKSSTIQIQSGQDLM
jgi:hypothetical protein